MCIFVGSAFKSFIRLRRCLTCVKNNHLAKRISGFAEAISRGVCFYLQMLSLSEALYAHLRVKFTTMPLFKPCCWGLFMAATLLVFHQNCTQPAPAGPLPILGNRDINAQGDTIYPSIPDFSFIGQDSQVVTNATFAEKIYIVDFFFIHCPTICPKVKAQMLRVHERFKTNPQVLLLSHSIDTEHDTVAALRKYAQKLGITALKWHFVTGVQDDIYGIADNYFSVATKNPEAPGGFDHSGRLILVDQRRHVRSFCDGTDPADVDRFMLDIERLLAEKG
jgi:protein SCO1